jgi:hypothetical protein
MTSFHICGWCDPVSTSGSTIISGCARTSNAIAKLPLAKDLENFVFDGTPVNENLVRDLAHHRNVVLVGGTWQADWRQTPT